ncbi:transcriptional regulator, LacI family [Loktanella fryxellensis]|uniref:Transcriptional regulator, LacI family n=1 Tax=Loktanella fryxellensis TaxID=245187 RepID=A0A1H8C2M7_9RHOB|nr:LacI family DNA-binding transcriptional regulator [Loktanella fryxellensis]SEM89232.1 transcriptional regulator, LacI family [Loktanella fryxellensis]
MKRAPTLADVATRAGVSYATVDRVVNARGSVATRSKDLVLQAVSDLGYVRNVAAANLAQARTYRFCCIIPDGTNGFMQRVCDILHRAAEALATDRVAVEVRRIAAFDPVGLRACLDDLAATPVDGIALVGTTDARVDAAIAALRRRGVAVVTLISDMPGSTRDAYVGIDNLTAGRTAAGLILLAHRGKAGRVLPIVGALSARDHADRIDGLRQSLAGSGVAVAPLIEGLDRHDVVAGKVQAALSADPGITAIYSAGAGNAGLFRVIAGWTDTPPRPMVVVHELLDASRQALEQGLIDIVIDQRPEDEVARTLDALRHMADRRPLPPLPQIVPAIYIKENLPVARSDSRPVPLAESA